MSDLEDLAILCYGTSVGDKCYVFYHI